MNAKKCLALLLSGCMAASMLAGCKNDDDSSSSSSSGSGSTGGDITWTDPDYDDDKDDGGASQETPKSFQVAVNVGDNGTVNPASPLTVKNGENAMFTVTANEGWLINEISVEGEDKLVYPTKEGEGPIETINVTLENVSQNRTVNVTFVKKTYTVFANVTNQPDGCTTTVNNGITGVEYGATASITVELANGYEATVTAKMGENDVTPTKSSDGKTYTIENVTDHITFFVTFTATGPTTDPSTWEVNANGTLVVPSVVTGTLSKTDVDTALDANDMGRTDLKRVDLSKSGLAEIGESAFAGCNQLIEVVMNDSIKTIGKNAFNTCSNLQTIDLQNIERIEMMAFYQCNTLKKANLANATYIGESAFDGCKMLKDLQLPKATEIGKSAFNGCTALTSVDLSAAEKIGETAFGGCTLLSQVYLRDIDSFGMLVFNGCNSNSGITIFYGEGGDDAKAALQKACDITDWEMTIGFEESQITFNPNTK